MGARHGRSATEGVDELVESLLREQPDALSVPLKLPPRGELEIQMVPLTLVQQLDELRGRAAAWVAAATLSTSVPVGIAVNWLTAEQPNTSAAAISVLSVFATFAVIAWCLAAVGTMRARRQRNLLLSLGKGK